MENTSFSLRLTRSLGPRQTARWHAKTLEGMALTKRCEHRDATPSTSMKPHYIYAAHR